MRGAVVNARTVESKSHTVHPQLGLTIRSTRSPLAFGKDISGVTGEDVRLSVERNDLAFISWDMLHCKSQWERKLGAAGSENLTSLVDVAPMERIFLFSS